MVDEMGGCGWCGEWLWLVWWVAVVGVVGGCGWCGEWLWLVW